MSKLADTTPLGSARSWLRKRVDDGERCPCCTQFAKVYRRKVNSSQARALIEVYRQSGTEWIHLPSLPGMGRLGGEWARLSYWRLVEESPDLRDDGGRAGWWRITPIGQAFVLGQITIPKYARIYDGRLLSLDPSEMVGIKDSLGLKFNYEELMRGV